MGTHDKAIDSYSRPISARSSDTAYEPFLLVSRRSISHRKSSFDTNFILFGSLIEQQISGTDREVITSSPELENSKAILRGFLELEDNWNTYGAVRFDLELINRVEAIISNIDVQPHIFATGRGSIQLEFEKNNGDYLEFEIYKDKITMLRILSDKEEEIDISSNQVNNYIIAFNAE